ncbi:unnamed protein product [Pedinophyceae sp. YPF-701]|nr:unnamed protein product [Pedinophyceae sp. YPF-701]
MGAGGRGSLDRRGSLDVADTRVRLKLVGAQGFQRHNHNPRSDRFEILGFHHVEFWCSDATNTHKRFNYGMGMDVIAKSDMSTGNHECASYVVRSGDVTFAFTAPYSLDAPRPDNNAGAPLPGYDAAFAHKFVSRHGLAARAIGLRVGDAKQAFEAAVAHGAIAVQEPTTLSAKAGWNGSVQVAEIIIYGETVLRLVSGDCDGGAFLPGYEPVDNPVKTTDFQFERIDHCVGNVWELIPAAEYLANATGMHEFAEFTAEDVGTVDSGLNSMVLASNSEMVLLPINEPTSGTRRKSQIQTYLEQNSGPGLQHIALKTKDIFYTLREMQERSYVGGFEFMPRPEHGYYERLPGRIGEGVLTPDEIRQCEELGVLVDRDDQGVLLQIFTRPLGDRPTVFIEVIQRLGCMREERDEATGEVVEVQKGGCGGFGKGNFKELFKSIEEYEKTLDV